MKTYVNLGILKVFITFFFFFLRTVSQSSLLPLPHAFISHIPAPHSRLTARQGSADPPSPRQSSSSHCRINKTTVNNLVNKGLVLKNSICLWVSYKHTSVEIKLNSWMRSHSHISSILFLTYFQIMGEDKPIWFYEGETQPLYSV